MTKQPTTAQYAAAAKVCRLTARIEREEGYDDQAADLFERAAEKLEAKAFVGEAVKLIKGIGLIPKKGA